MSDTITVEVRLGFEVMDEYRFSSNKQILVGRCPDADIPLDAHEVSRRHALLIPGKNSITVRDLSQNGILQGGVGLKDGADLAFWTPFQVGPFSLVFKRKEAPSKQSLAKQKRRILERLIEHVELASIDRHATELRPRVEAALERIAVAEGVSKTINMPTLIKELADEALGLGPLESLLADGDVSEIMVINPHTIFVERKGCLEKTQLGFTSEKAVRTVIERIITPLGRRIDESSPMVDARLADGSRVNVVIPPLAILGACITIRKFSQQTYGLDDLVEFGSMTPSMADFLCQAVIARANIIISGGTGSGKTTLLGVLSSAIPETERIVTVEDAAELRLSQSHVVPLESKPQNAEGKGQVTIRDLVRNALRMRPDRIVVGECRGGEALDMLQAMNTGHDGSLTTLHANSPAEAISRLETLCLMSGIDLPARAIREQIAQAVDLIVQQTRLQDGSRRIVSIAEVSGIEQHSNVQLNEIFRFIRRDDDPNGGVFQATGWLPTCLGEAALTIGTA